MSSRGGRVEARTQFLMDKNEGHHEYETIRVASKQFRLIASARSLGDRLMKEQCAFGRPALALVIGRYL